MGTTIVNDAYAAHEAKRKAEVAAFIAKQDQEDREFVSLHGLPEKETKTFDKLVLRYGWRGVANHLDRSMVTWCKMPGLTLVEIDRLLGNVEEMREGDLKEECKLALANPIPPEATPEPAPDEEKPKFESAVRNKRK
jgi:hypothetical protein